MSHEYSTEYVLPNGDMTFSLSEYVQANVDAERERIVKLLEEQIEVHEFAAAIELIKGETNG